MEAWILVDFGMTVSAGQAIKIPSLNSTSLLGSHFLGKIPTTIRYDQDDKVVKIGESLSSDPLIQKHFKALIPLLDLSNDPSEFKKAKKLISDYLRKFCGDLLQLFLAKEHIASKDLRVKWYLTTPDRWSNEDQRNFEEIAHKVLVALHPGSEVSVDLWESTTSCEFLVDHLQLPPGTWALTCDIGGATIDTAMCVTKRVKDRIAPVTFPIWSEGAGGHLHGVVDIDEGLAMLVNDILNQTGIQKLDTGAKLEQIIYTDQWRDFRHAFQGDCHFTFGVENDLKHDGDGRYSIRGNMITISSSAIEGLFDLLFQPLYKELRIAMERLGSVKNAPKTPNLIALCGGGGAMLYLLKQLKSRYPAIPIMTAHTIEESCLATLKGHQIYRLRDMLDNYLKKIHLGVSLPSRDPLKTVQWRQKPSPVNIFEFSASPAQETQVHYVLIHIKGDMRPEQFLVDSLTKEPGKGDRALVWRLEVPLVKSWRKQEYSIVVECTGHGRGALGFKAYDKKRPSVMLDLLSEAYYCS